MKLIKELPQVFEEFAQQRKNSFLALKEIKDKGIPVVGAYCTYFPREIAMAMGAVTVGLCSTSDETIPVAEKDLPKNLCPLIKSSYGFAVTDKCPFFYFSDVVVGETTCDGKKKMYEYMEKLNRFVAGRTLNVKQLDNSRQLMKGLDAATAQYRDRPAQYQERPAGSRAAASPGTKEGPYDKEDLDSAVNRKYKE